MTVIVRVRPEVVELERVNVPPLLKVTFTLWPGCRVRPGRCNCAGIPPTLVEEETDSVCATLSDALLIRSLSSVKMLICAGEKPVRVISRCGWMAYTVLLEKIKLSKRTIKTMKSTTPLP